MDVERDAKLLPSFVKGERIVMVAAGDVDASVDFRQLGRKLDAAASADRELLPAAERNTRAMLERLARGLGFERVIVRFEQPSAV